MGYNASMSKQSTVVEKSPHPITVAQILSDLKKLGLAAGDTVLVHSSLSSLGWVAGGEQAVVEALLQAVLPSGTLVMPTHSSHLTEPRLWQNPPVPESFWEIIRAETPAYNPYLTPTCGMGAIVNCFLRVPGVFRSSHPTHSFAAFGDKAAQIISSHSLEDGMGENSPLARLVELNAKILLLGVGFESCTMLHLAEVRANYSDKGSMLQGSPMMVDKQRLWVEYRELNYNSDDFVNLGDDFLAAGHAKTGSVGLSKSHLLYADQLLRFAIPWLEKHRNQGDMGSDLMWNPVQPDQLPQLLKGFSDWCLAGGCSVDWLIGKTTRTHADTDIAIMRSDLRSCLACFSQDQVLLCAKKGLLVPWQGTQIPEDIHSIWIRDQQNYILQILIFDCHDDTISYRRDKRIRWPLASLWIEHRGMRLLNPGITMLFKLHGRELLPKDCHDVGLLVEYFSSLKL